MDSPLMNFFYGGVSRATSRHQTLLDLADCLFIGLGTQGERFKNLYRMIKAQDERFPAREIIYDAHMLWAHLQLVENLFDCSNDFKATFVELHKLFKEWLRLGNCNIEIDCHNYPVAISDFCTVFAMLISLAWLFDVKVGVISKDEVEQVVADKHSNKTLKTIDLPSFYTTTLKIISFRLVARLVTGSPGGFEADGLTSTVKFSLTHYAGDLSRQKVKNKNKFLLSQVRECDLVFSRHPNIYGSK